MSNLSEHAVFQAVAQYRSFPEAARSLSISRSHASRMVARLEERLGVRLFTRTTRRVTMTDAGRHLLASTEGALEALAAGEAQVSEAGAVLRGTVRVSAPYEFGEVVLMPVLLGFQEKHPQVELRLSLSNDRVDLLDGRFDLAVRGGHLSDSSLHARRLWRFKVALVASPEYIQQHGVPAHPSELERHTCLGYTQMRRPDRWLFVAPDGNVLEVPIQARFHSNYPGALLRAACAGAGVSIHPDFVVAPLVRTGRLVRLLESWSPEAHFHAVVPHRTLLPMRVRALLDHLADEVPRVTL